jgi:PadR family transcriptional regulator AphA
MEELGWL